MRHRSLHQCPTAEARMASDPIIPQQTNKDVKSAWICCFHSLIHECRWIIHMMSAEDNGGGQAKAVFLCFPDALTSETSTGGWSQRWKIEVTFEVYACAKCSVWMRAAPYHPSIHLPLTVSNWPLTWDTNTLNADAGLSSLRFNTYALRRLAKKHFMLALVLENTKQYTEAYIWSLYSDFSVVLWENLHQNSDLLQNLNSIWRKNGRYLFMCKIALLVSLRTSPCYVMFLSLKYSFSISKTTVLFWWHHQALVLF